MEHLLIFNHCCRHIMVPCNPFSLCHSKHPHCNCCVTWLSDRQPMTMKMLSRRLWQPPCMCTAWHQSFLLGCIHNGWSIPQLINTYQHAKTTRHTNIQILWAQINIRHSNTTHWTQNISKQYTTQVSNQKRTHHYIYIYIYTEREREIERSIKILELCQYMHNTHHNNTHQLEKK